MNWYKKAIVREKPQNGIFQDPLYKHLLFKDIPEKRELTPPKQTTKIETKKGDIPEQTLFLVNSQKVGSFSMHKIEPGKSPYYFDYAYLYNFGIIPAYQGLGFAEILCSKVEEQAKELGARGILLEVDPNNLVAINLYLKFGFVKSDKQKGYFMCPRCTQMNKDF